MLPTPKKKYFQISWSIKRLDYVTVKKRLEFNALFYVFIFLQLLLVIFSQMTDSVIGDRLNNININYAIIIHICILFFFSIGYKPFSKKDFIQCYLIKKKEIVLYKRFTAYSIVFVIIGLITSIATIAQIISPIEYLSKIFQGGSVGELTKIRKDSGRGGLPGILKMLNYLPLGVFLIINGIKVFYEVSKRDNLKLNFILYFSLIVCFIKMLFSLDRLTLLAILLVFVYRCFLDKKISLKTILPIFIVFLALGFITSIRLNDRSILEFVIVYFKLSMVNFQLVLENQNEWSYGFSTFLMPITFVLKFFGIENFCSVEPKKYVVDQAQYFTSYLYIDFGVIFYIFFYLMGIFVKWIQIKSILGVKFYPQIYFITLFALGSFVSVPIIRGVELWVMILLACIYNKLFKII